MTAPPNVTQPTILTSQSTKPPVVPSAQPGETGQGVIDSQTFRVIEVDQLFTAIDHTTTAIGRAVLYRSLTAPSAAADEIRAKQEAVRELESEPALRDGLGLLLAEAAKLEGDFYDLLFAEFLGMIGSPAHPLEKGGFGYESYRRGTRFWLDLVARADTLPTPRSAYLAERIELLRRFRDSRAFRLMRGPVYRTEHALKTAEEKSLLTPALRFNPSLFKPVGLTVFVVALVLLMQFMPLLLEMVASMGPLLWLFLFPLGFVYIPIVGAFDRDGCIYPLRKLFKESPDVQGALDALGAADELLSFVRYREAFGHPVCLPDIEQGRRHSLRVSGVRNPVLAKDNPDYVANDIDLSEERLSFVTGPNSGGKTAFCKTLAQTQLLAQIGCYVPASSAALTPADRIFYQVPEISHLSDGEGRFGTELKRTKAIFLASTAHSLVIMDELSEGTTNEEKMEISVSVLDGFREMGNSTVLITHNHELVDAYRQRGIGLARQVEFRDENPTYRLVDGISRVSHADRIAKKIGFSKADIAKYLTGRR